MTIILPPTRGLSHRVWSRTPQLAARVSLTSNPILRVGFRHHVSWGESKCDHDCLLTSRKPVQARSYATTAPTKPVGRPKAHTGRTAARKTPITPKAIPGAKTAKKPGPRKTASKAAASKKKPGKKLKSKAKAKPKAKKRPVSKSALRKIEVQKSQDLKAAALLKPPKRLPETAWTLIFSEGAVKGAPISGDRAKEAAQKYRNLASEQHEQYNHTANENKSKNVAEYKRWLSTYTPAQIKAANTARNALRKQAKAAGKKTTYPHIQDERLVKQAISPYAYFLQARVGSGDMKGMKISEIGPLVAREWKGLSASDKKEYEDLGARDKNRYLEEYKSVYGEDSPSVKTAKKT